MPRAGAAVKSESQGQFVHPHRSGTRPATPISAFMAVLLATLGSGCAPSSPQTVSATPTATTTAPRTGGATPAAPPSWHVVSGATTGDDGLSLSGVTCPGIHDCWAVGLGFDGSADTAVIEHYTGESWSIVPAGIPSPTPGPGGTLLSAVTCATTSDCWAVGSQYPSSAGQALIEHYAGSGWSAVPTPTPSGPVDSRLDSVTCVSPSDCWAVGVTSNYGNGINQGLVEGLVEQYTGGGWSIVASPTPGPGTGNSLSSVTCVSADDCWAVGVTNNYGNGANKGFVQGLVEQYTGGGWTVVTSPPLSGGTGSGLSAVACVSAVDCWAVGSTMSDANGDSQGLIERYAGNAWSIVVSPALSPSVGLLGVTCTDADSCWSAGDYSPANPETFEEFLPLMERYAGGAWDVFAAPALSGEGASLASVTCIDADACWAVGHVTVNESGQALIEQFS